MNLKETKYSKFSLCREMLKTASVIANFNNNTVSGFVKVLSTNKSVFLTGEGSSRMEYTCGNWNCPWY